MEFQAGDLRTSADVEAVERESPGMGVPTSVSCDWCLVQAPAIYLEMKGQVQG